MMDDDFLRPFGTNFTKSWDTGILGYAGRFSNARLFFWASLSPGVCQNAFPGSWQSGRMRRFANLPKTLAGSLFSTPCRLAIDLR
jgi:hypothetical protein